MRLFTVADNLNSDDWYTPPWVFNGLNIRFDIDVASPEGGVPWIPADTYFTENDNGLQQDWQGTIWCNPPYSASKKWCHKMVEHGNGIIVIRADLSSGGYIDVFESADAMWVPGRRLQFVNGHSETTSSVTFTTCLFAFGYPSITALERIADINGVTRMLG